MSFVTTSDRREAFARRLYDATTGGLDVATAYLGLRLGLYRSLADDGSATSVELAARTGTNERLVREWLEQQAATEVLDAARDDAGAWRFAMPAEHASVLLDPEAAGPHGRHGAGAGRRSCGAAAPGRGVPDRSRHPVRGLRPGRVRGSGDVEPADLPRRDPAVVRGDAGRVGPARRARRPRAGHRVRPRVVLRQHRQGLPERAGRRRRPRRGVDHRGQGHRSSRRAWRTA